jgi:hypothetical protein
MQTNLPTTGGFGRGQATEAAATRIRVLLPGKRRNYTYLTFLQYKSLGTAHTVTIMRGQSYTTCATAVAEAGTALVVTSALLDGAGNALAANDLVAFECVDGSWQVDIIAGWVVGTKTITLAVGPATGSGGIAVGGRVISYGIAGDSGHAAYTLLPPVSATTNFPPVLSGPLARSRQKNEPIILDSDNATAAGIFMQSNVVYSREG